MKLKNGKRKLNENSQNIKQQFTHMIFNNMRRSNILMKMFILVKLT